MPQFTMIYNASGTLLGELKYITNKVFYGQKCGACDISHGLLLEKREFTCVKEKYSLVNLHTNELSPKMREFVSNLELPIVLQHTDNQFKVAFTAKDLSEMKGSVQVFESKLQDYIKSSQ